MWTLRRQARLVRPVRPFLKPSPKMLARLRPCRNLTVAVVLKLHRRSAGLPGPGLTRNRVLKLTLPVQLVYTRKNPVTRLALCPTLAPYRPLQFLWLF